MGTEPHRSRRSSSAGVATAGVALQGPAVKKSTSTKSGSVQKQGSSSVQKTVCKSGSVQETVCKRAVCKPLSD